MSKLVPGIVSQTLSGGHTTPVFRGFSTNLDFSTNIDPANAGFQGSVAASAVTGDLLITYIQSKVAAGVALSMTADGGQAWTEITDVAITGSFRAWWAIYNGTLTTMTLHQTHSGWLWGGLAAYSGVDATTPIDTTSAVQGGTSGGGTDTIPAITTVTDHTLRVVIADFDDSGSGGGGGSGPVYTASPPEVTRDGSGVSGSTNYIGDIEQITPGTSPAEAFTVVFVSRVIAHIALRPV